MFTKREKFKSVTLSRFIACNSASRCAAATAENAKCARPMNANAECAQNAVVRNATVENATNARERNHAAVENVRDAKLGAAVEIAKIAKKPTRNDDF